VKLLRDGKLHHLFQIRLLDKSVQQSLATYMFHRFYEGLRELGMIKVTKGRIVHTGKLSKLLSALDLSLTQLADFDSQSVVCSPFFGTPSSPATVAEIFVVMPFAEAMRPVYEDHIKRVARQLNRSVARADDFFSADSIMSDVWNAISAARVIIADCTGRNPNVFYEIGLAHTLGKPVVLASQTAEDIPFDVRHVRTIIYEYSPRGMLQFERNLRKTVESALDNDNRWSLQRRLQDIDPEFRRVLRRADRDKKMRAAHSRRPREKSKRGAVRG
jgi:hypothetical protein